MPDSTHTLPHGACLRCGRPIAEHDHDGLDKDVVQFVCPLPPRRIEDGPPPLDGSARERWLWTKESAIQLLRLGTWVVWEDEAEGDCPHCKGARHLPVFTVGGAPAGYNTECRKCRGLGHVPSGRVEQYVSRIESRHYSESEDGGANWGYHFEGGGMVSSRSAEARILRLAEPNEIRAEIARQEKEDECSAT